ncbi:CHAT domain-containing protein [Streptomyces sp. NPDC006658]|uniref:CHAT domain-containing protein n=1 Tax=Streptomyces sp. NPDC006658 TaxID=3156900 RepID=UPI0033DB161F
MPDPFDLESLVRSVKAVIGDRAWSTATERLGAMVAQHSGTADAAAAFDLHYAHWRSMPATDPRRPAFAGYLLQLVPLMRQSGPCCTYEQAKELAAAARTAPDPEWQAFIKGVLALVVLHDTTATLTDPGLLEKAVEELDSASRLLPAMDEMPDATTTGFAIGRAVARADHARLRGGEGELEKAIEELNAARRALADRPDDQAYLTCYIACLRAGRAHLRKDEEALARYVREQEIALARLPRHHPARDSAESWLATNRFKLRDLIADRTDGPWPGPRPRHGAHKRPDTTDPYALVQAALEVIAAAAYDEDPEAMAEAIGLLQEALERCEEDDEHWVRCAAQLATAHLLRAGLIRWEPKPLSHLSPAGRQIIAHIDQAISLLRRVRRTAEGPAHPIWTGVGRLLADALRLRSMMMPQFRSAAAARLWKESRDIGLAALSGLAWSVILQSGTEHAMEAGNRAMEEYCLDIARWCVVDGELDAAVRALDSGRALMLHAAQVSATVPDMLRQLGQDQLAEEWRAAGSLPFEPEPGPLGRLGPTAALHTTGPDVRLRRRVLKVLAASPYRDRLLATPAPAEIAGGLRTLGADALVYLVPAGNLELLVRRSRKAPGAALIVGADGALRSVELPDLRLDAPELTDYRAAAGAGWDPRRRGSGSPRRDAGPVTAPQGGVPPRAAEALDRLCGWAWQSVLAPLTAEFVGNGGFYGAQPGPARIPSVVLVPLGALGAVPWHAAWRAEGPGRRYTLEELQVSYAPSARTLCEVAGRTPPEARASGSRALVIGNPTGDLRYAGEEAEAIHRVFYPDGTYLDADTADATEVSARLARLRGGVLHLACHARVDPGERHSAYLGLAAGSRLAAEELTEGTARRIEPGLVCLAACWSNVSSRGYDEAYSLATAFLAAGAHTVLGSLWPVPDEDTSLLMYMTHHYLRREALPPGQALRRAQLWMLDPRRRTPPEMPARLAVRARHIRPDNLAGWAGFTHQGW